MKPVTIFTFGYYGWGNHTPQLVEAVDAVELARGFKPPLFVDIRIRRSVRAKGFTGTAFENLLGGDRHRWMKTLGNKFIETRTGPNIQIADPTTANKLLDLAIDLARRKQRLLFFCSCQWPKCDGKVSCHRTTVAGLVHKAAKKRRVPIQIVEWPGGEVGHLDIEVKPEMFSALAKGRMAIPLDKRRALAEVTGLPWCSTATIISGEKQIHRIVGPAFRQKETWAVPILYLDLDPAVGLGTYRRKAMVLRRSWGLEPQFNDNRPGSG